MDKLKKNNSADKTIKTFCEDMGSLGYQFFVTALNMDKQKSFVSLRMEEENLGFAFFMSFIKMGNAEIIDKVIPAALAAKKKLDDDEVNTELSDILDKLELN